MSAYTQPERRAFSLRSIGGPSVMRTVARSPSTTRAPFSVTIGSVFSADNESRSSRG